MNKGEILVAIHNMRGEYAHKAGEALKRIGKQFLEGPILPIMPGNPNLSRAYYEAQAKVSVLDELLEKIANTPDEVKHDETCTLCEIDAQEKEIARAKGDI